MCNNLLQYGHVYAWGREHGRRTMSMRFAYKYPYFHICDTRYHNFATYLFAKYGSKLRLIPTVAFSTEDADTTELERRMEQSRLIVAEGWYARWYDLFLKYKGEIIRLFDFKPKVKELAVRTLKEHGGACNLGVHIRRGDYRTWMGGRFFYSDEQYIGVIRQFCRLHSGTAVFICGNDPELDEEKYRSELGGRVCFAKGNPGEDLCLLSECDYLVGAPSTFTLTASMYHDTPLYWIEDPAAELTEESFGHFDQLFRHIK